MQGIRSKRIAGYDVIGLFCLRFGTRNDIIRLNLCTLRVFEGRIVGILGFITL